MPEKKVQRIEKIQFANMGYKAVGIYARVKTNSILPLTQSSIMR